MIDGIDGSGKSTIIEAWKKNLTDNGKKIFDLKKYFLDNNRYPEMSDWIDCDIIFSAEPTHAGIGKILRDELINTKNNYSATTIAEAHSLDRAILYTKVIIPALKNNKIIVQDRGLSTSLAYQPSQNSELTLSKVANYAGNQIAAQYRPDHLVLMDIDPNLSFDRLTSRFEKVDNAIFEKKDFLIKASKKYNDEEFKNFFENIGTQIHHLSGEEKIDIMKAQAISWLINILK